MNEQKKENLKELLAGFMNPQTARQTAEDIEKGNRLLNSFPSPQPSQALLAGIKNNISRTLRRRQNISMHRRIWAVAGVAAAIIVISVTAVSIFKGPRQPVKKINYASIIPARVWEGSDITSDDTDIAVLYDEIETVENELIAMGLDEQSDNSSTDVSDLELELIEISGDFWKG